MFQVKREIELSWAFYMIVVYFVKIKAFNAFLVIFDIKYGK